MFLGLLETLVVSLSFPRYHLGQLGKRELEAEGPHPRVWKISGYHTARDTSGFA